MDLKAVCLPLVAVAALVVVSAQGAVAMPLAGAATLSQDGIVVEVARKKKRMTRQQEIDRSVESGTVPSRYRSSVPKEYQQYVPFEKKR